jgi:hypothetical protein
MSYFFPVDDVVVVLAQKNSLRLWEPALPRLASNTPQPNKSTKAVGHYIR